MSFILESIKQAERDRKLGQQKAPEISIEYSAAHIEDIENNNKRWWLFLTGLTATAILVWGIAYYLTNKDRQYVDQLSVNEFSNVNDSEAKVTDQGLVGEDVTSNSIPVTDKETINPTTSFVSVSTKKLHTSDLKSVELIVEQEKVPVSHIGGEPEKNNQLIQEETVLNSNSDAEVSKVLEANSIVESTIDKKPKVLAPVVESVSNKQELAKIYADLASLDDAESVSADDLKSLDKIEEQQVQLKTANYIVPKPSDSINKNNETAKLSGTNFTKQHEQAVNSGVPSFGELPYAIQEKIPDINVSVHMFHADPLQRRIRVNGKMYTEGKSLQQDLQGLALVEITRYGAVFDYEGNLFRFNVR